MNSIQIKCKNPSCHLSRYPMPWPDGRPLAACPICGSAMEVAESTQDEGAGTGSSPDHWLLNLADDPEFWAPDAEQAYPAVIAYKYRSLKEYCRKEAPYAVLLCLKDNFEALLKMQVLIAYAWASKNTDEGFETETISRLTKTNLSLGNWVGLATTLINNLKNVAVLPAAIPLNKLRKGYEEKKIVYWRNVNIGHGAMGISEDEEFKQDIQEKILVLKDLFLSVDSQLRSQELYLPREEEGSTEISLTGADRARGLERGGQVHFRTRDGKVDLCVDPFIVIRWNERRGFGTYFFDNQKTDSLTHFLAYPDGSWFHESSRYFKALRRRWAMSGVKEESMADDPYLTEEESRELDLLQMSHDFVEPKHLEKWLKKCLKDYDKGIFLLQMDRGTGKSVFTEKISGLAYNPLALTGDTDVRTYHFGRTQTAGSQDIRSMIEWLWSKDHSGRSWARSPRISDYEREGMDPKEALCAYLEEIQKYSRRNRGKEKILMVFDGLDEITEKSLWEFIPKEEMLKDGIYFLLASRDPEKEELPGDIAFRLKELAVTDRYRPQRMGAENTAFLKRYIKRAGLKELEEEDIDRLLELSGYRVLELGLLCKLLAGGMEIADLPDSGRAVSAYLGELEERYGENEAVRVRALLAVLCTLGAYEGLTLETLGVLTGEPGVTLRLIGTVRDLLPMLKTERSEEGNLYMIANPDLAGELMGQIPETEETVRFIVKLTMAVMLDGNLEKEKSLEPAAAHVAELAEEILPEKLGALGDDPGTVLWDNMVRAEALVTDKRSRERLLDYRRQSFIYYKGTVGAAHPDTLLVQETIAAILRELGRFKEALVIGRDAYENVKRELGEEDPDTLKAKCNIAVTLIGLGRYEEALEVFSDVYEKRKSILGEKHPDTLVVQEHVAIALEMLGRYEEALGMFSDIYEKRKSMLGEDHPDTLSAKSDLAGVMSFLGRYEEALGMFSDVYEKRKKALGEDNPKTLLAQSNMASLLEQLGRHKKALEMFSDVYEKRKSVLGEDHPDTLLAQNNMASSLVKLRRYKEALEMISNVYEKRKSVLGEDHPDTLLAQSNLAGVLFYLGRYEKALKTYRKVYKKSKSVLGEEHPNTFNTRYCMAVILVALNRYKEALEIFREVYEKRKEVLGPDHPDTLAIRKDIATTLRLLSH